MADKDIKKPSPSKDKVIKYLERVKKHNHKVHGDHPEHDEHKKPPINGDKKPHEGDKKPHEDDKKSPKPTDIEKLEHAIQELFNEYDDLKWKEQLSVSNEVNLKNKFMLEKSDLIKYNGADLAKSVLVPFDMLKRVVRGPSPSPEVENYLKGFEMVIGQIENAFSDAGVSVVEPKPGDSFDQNLHEAVETVETEAHPKGKIAHIISNGYKLKDRVIIYAKVKVAG